MPFEKLGRALKHGKHNQTSHGRRGGSGGGGGASSSSGGSEAGKTGKAAKSKKLAAKGWSAGDEKAVKGAGFRVLGGLGSEDAIKKGPEKREVTISKRQDGKFRSTGTRQNVRDVPFTDKGFTGGLAESIKWGDDYLATPGLAQLP